MPDTQCPRCERVGLVRMQTVINTGGARRFFYCGGCGYTWDEEASPAHEQTPPPATGFIFEHDSARRRVVITLSTKSTVEIWHAAVATIAAANLWLEPVIYDMSAVDSAPLLVNLPNLVPVVANLHEAHGQREAVAVIVGNHELSIWERRLEPFRPLLAIEAFVDVASAHAWLDGIATASMGRR